KTKPIAPLQKKPFGSLNKNKNCKNTQRHFFKINAIKKLMGGRLL
ncbi:hypothetical protein N405_00345, partial [Helicobacter pylori FD568]